MIVITLDHRSKMYLEALRLALPKQDATANKDTPEHHAAYVADTIKRLTGESYLNNSTQIQFHDPKGFENQGAAEKALSVLLQGLERERSRDSIGGMIPKAAQAIASKGRLHSHSIDLRLRAPDNFDDPKSWDLKKQGLASGERTLVGSVRKSVEAHLPPEWQGWELGKELKRECIADIRQAAQHAVIELGLPPSLTQVRSSGGVKKGQSDARGRA